jgi:hypothetical protein
MKKFKQIDLGLQLAALLGGIVCALPHDGELAFLFAYFFVGGAQLLSFFAHLIADPAIGFTVGRKWYACFLAILAALLLTGWISDSEGILILVLYPLLLIAPVVAILYAGMCYNELQQLKLVKHETE